MFTLITGNVEGTIGARKRLRIKCKFDQHKINTQFLKQFGFIESKKTTNKIQ